MIFDIDVEKIIGYSFKDKMLLRQCFTHASYANEHGEKDNELLEFFGDAIIQYVVTEYLYKNSAGDEGKLTQKRASMVSKGPLLKAVISLGLNEYVLLGRGLEKSASLDEKLFSSIYEALVAGIYLDGGMVPVKKFIKETLIKEFDKQEKAVKSQKQKNDGKNALQEYVQKNKLGTISYETLSKTGPDHSPEFRVAVLINGTRIAEGKGQSKKTAESVSAVEALKIIKKQGGKTK
jgi:ribonuclease-3